MFEKRRVHDLNWFHKNCEIQLNNSYHYIGPPINEHDENAFVYSMWKFAGKEVHFDSIARGIQEFGWWWDEWMFESKGS